MGYMKKFIIWVVIILLIIGGGIVWYTHRSVDQVKTQDDLDLLDSLRDLEDGSVSSPVVDEVQSGDVFRDDSPVGDAEGTQELPDADVDVPDNNSVDGGGDAAEVEETTLPSNQETPDPQTLRPQPEAEPQPQARRETNSEVSVLKEGTFDPDAEDSDSIHRGWGGVKVVNFRGKNKVVFGEDFRVTRGPDYFLYLVGERNVETERQFRSIKDASYNISEIKQYSGEQTFDIPDNIDIDDIQGVVIWCESFSQFISYANVE